VETTFTVETPFIVLGIEEALRLATAERWSKSEFYNIPTLTNVVAPVNVASNSDR
jgi:hypothetical protein